MESDRVATSAGAGQGRVMAAVEGASEETFILADVSRDGAYLTMPLGAAATLSSWR